jgi:hypothetical protein
MRDTTNQDGQILAVKVTDDLSVQIVPNKNNEWLMTTSEVAKGYGVSKSTIWNHHSRYSSEFIDGHHFIKGLTKSEGLPNSQPHQVYWTKAGVIRLGFHIKSERAKQFRDWAEKVVLAVTAPTVKLTKPRKRRHNRLTQARMVELLSLVALVEDDTLRRELVLKLNPDAAGIQLQLDIPKTDDHA